MWDCSSIIPPGAAFLSIILALGPFSMILAAPCNSILFRCRHPLDPRPHQLFLLVHKSLRQAFFEHFCLFDNLGRLLNWIVQCC